MPPESAPQAVATFPKAWRSVSFGTMCLSVGALVTFAGMLLLPALVFLEVQLINDRAGMTFIAIPKLTCLLVVIVGYALILMGTCLCCVAPAESGARPMAAAVIAWLLFLLLTVNAALPSLQLPRDPRFAGGFDRGDPLRALILNQVGTLLAANVLGFASLVFVACFTCVVAHHLGNESLARGVHWFLMYLLFALICFFLVIFTFGFVMSTWPNLSAWWTVPPLALGLVLICGIACGWLLRLLANARHALTAAEQVALVLDELERAE